MTATSSTQADNGAEPGHSVGSRRHRRGFGVVAFAFLVVMALGTVPSPLYGLYRARDHFSLFMVTVAFAVYAVGVIVALPGAAALSRTLRLDHDERSHLFALAAAQDPTSAEQCDAVTPQMPRLAHQAEPVPGMRARRKV